MTVIVFYQGIVRGKSVERVSDVVETTANEFGLVIRLNMTQQHHTTGVLNIPLSDIAHYQVIP